MRQGGGLSGYTKRSESEFDPFGAAHTSTSISSALGMQVAADMQGEAKRVVAVIGDGAISAGMAYEALNNAGAMKNRLIVILNDNDMSIAPPVGAMSAYLSRMASSKSYRSMRHMALDVVEKLPDGLAKSVTKAESYARGLVTGGGTLFEEMGFYYVGPVDGHNLDHLLPDPPQRSRCKGRRAGPDPCRDQEGPRLRAGRGGGGQATRGGRNSMSSPARRASRRPTAPTYTSVFAKALIAEAEADDKIVAITAAMPSGTGVDKFEQRFPDRTFDVGIAEQHAVTFAAGLVCEGLKPFAAIYSTFLQRAYDQIQHDVALQNLAVRFCIDRAGLVGADGATHAGAFDIAYLGCLPNMMVMAAGDELDLMHMVATQAAYDQGPSALRYPRGEGVGLALPARGEILQIGKGRIIQEGSKIAILNFGARLAECRKAAAELNARGLSTTLADARFAKPLDTDMIKQLVKNHEVLITIEEGSLGGFGAYVLQYLAGDGLLDAGLKVRTMTLPDSFQDHDTPLKQYDEAGLNAQHIVAKAMAALGVAEVRDQVSEVSLIR